jgi:adenine-specific DNA-methyltransferase
LVAHLKSFAAHITSDNAPFGLHRPKALNVFENRRKIVMVRKTPYPKFALVPDQCFVDEGCYILLPLQTGPTEEFFCGVFNSSIAHFWFRMHKTQGGQLQIDKEILLSLPIVVRPSRTVTAGADMTVGELLQRHAKLSDENDRWNLCREVIIHCVRRLTKSFTATDYELCDAAVGLMYGFGLKELADVRKLLEGEA